MYRSQIIKETINNEKKSEIINIASTFTINSILPGLKFWINELNYTTKVELAPYNQVFQQLLLKDSMFNKNSYGMNVIIFRLEDFIFQSKRYKKNHRKEISEQDCELLDEIIIDFIKTLNSYTKKAPCHTLLLLCPSNFLLYENTIKHYKNQQEKISREISKLNGITMLIAEDFHSIYSMKDYFDPIRDEMGHIPYIQEYFHFLSTLIIRRYFSLKNKMYKAIILDCDNTLWKGICGENGPESVRIDGAFFEFQKYLVKQSEQGMVLCLCSKNNEEDVWKVFEIQKNMPLKEKYIVDSRINWLPKSENIRNLAEKLNLGSDSFIFIDDNPVECAEVRANCPEVLVIQLPSKETDIVNMVNHLWILDHYSVTDEDKKRAMLYRANTEREDLRENSVNFQDFLKSLNLKITIKRLKKENLKRVAQLIERTNQFNFTTIRRTEEQIKTLLIDKKFECLTVEVEDRFGSYGLTGVIIYQQEADTLRVDTFLLSCRVLGRGVEYAIVSRLAKIAQNKNLHTVLFIYVQTQKNEPSKRFLLEIGKEYMRENEKNEIEFSLPVSLIKDITYSPQNDPAKITRKSNTEEILSIPQDMISSIRDKESQLSRIMHYMLDQQSLFKKIYEREINNEEKKQINKTGMLPHTSLYGSVLNDVLSCFADELSINIDTLSSGCELSHYKIDSFKIIEITKKLSMKFQNVPTTLLFECQSIKDIAEYLINNNQDDLIKRYKIQDNDMNEIEKTNQSFKPGNMKHRSYDSNENDIAIIGIGCRYPKSNTVDEYWENLMNGKSCITEIPEDRWDIESFFDPSDTKRNTTYSKWIGIIDNVDKFDAGFFYISPREAETMDPQQRLFMEVVWNTIEDAGYTKKFIEKDTGVYVGVISNDYCTISNIAALKGNCPYRNSEYYQIPNRISYFFNFKGPSIAIDTACSSSGTAIHLACESLKKRECKLAIVGGVNLFLYPSRYIQYSRMKMMSYGNKCKPFGIDADGTIFGEGIGAVILKPLIAAEQDRDTIYGVIKGSAINSGGKTNGFTVPNPNAQAELIKKAMSNAGIDPRTISYLEAHGTGTSLGDPIEIRGLTQAFKESTTYADYLEDKQFCAIGSVKSNIGHLESGAAIAGLIKVLLQMKYRKIVPSLNSENPNPLIPFIDTPFYVQNKLSDWKKPRLKMKGKWVEFPRRSGISTFGAGGSNVHIIVEEYETDKRRIKRRISKNPGIIVLSGKNEERLKKIAGELLEWLERRKQNIQLEDIAYTLQVGRQAMKERLGIIAGSIKELEEKLKSYIEGKKRIKDVYSGQISRNQEILDLFDLDEELQEALEKWIQRKKYGKLLDLWVKGLPFDWNKLYKEEKPYRINLPGYPFADERYWIEEESEGPGRSFINRLHPLLHENNSNFVEQRFNSVFNGDEFFIAHYRINEQKILPGVAHLEMVRAAVEASSGSWKGETNKLLIKNIVWTLPVLAGEEPVNVTTGLIPEESGEIIYEVYSASENNQEDIIYSQGKIQIIEVGEEKTIDINKMQYSKWDRVLTSEELYTEFKNIGINYGPCYRGIETVYIGEEKVLAKLSMPVLVIDTMGEYTFHPSVLESALQAVTGLLLYSGKPQAPIPANLDLIEIIGSCDRSMWAVVGYHEEKKNKKFDIDLCDDKGRVRVRMKGLELQEDIEVFMSNALELKYRKTHKPNKKEPYELMTFEEVWQEQALSTQSRYEKKTIVCFLSNKQKQRELSEVIAGQNVKLIFIKQGNAFKKQSEFEYSIIANNPGSFKEAFDNIRKQVGEVNAVVYFWAIEDKKSIREYSRIVYMLQGAAFAGFKPDQYILAGEFKEETGGIDRCYLESWIGIERSVGLIMPRTVVRCIYEEMKEGEETGIKVWMKRVWKELGESKGRSVLYRDGKRHVYRIRPVKIELVEGKLQKGGTYLITGGCGGLGFIFAKHLAGTRGANLILTGRSDLDEEKREKIKVLENTGSRVLYFKADVCDLRRMEEVYKKIKDNFGKINGIIHAAGIPGGQSILTKDIKDFQKVLDPKVKGTIVLDEMINADEIDFVCYFSSSSGILGDLGSCDYAIGNRFLMSYTLYRNQVREKKGKTLVINWPIWREGRMGLGDNDTTMMYLKSSGQRLLESEEGTSLFERLLMQKKIQYLIIAGQKGRVYRFLGLTEERKNITISKVSGYPGKGKRAGMKGLSVEECVEWDLKNHISRLLKISKDKISLEANLADFGFDSISLSEFASDLSRYYGVEITPAIFFGHSTVGKLVKYFLQEYQVKINGFYQEEAVKECTKEEIFDQKLVKRQRHRRDRFKSIIGSVTNNEPVAIIGMSGRFPESRNINEMWKILVEGREVIKEYPKDRFVSRIWEKSRWRCGCIPGISEFDPLFFEISPREAESMDPRQRLLLQESWNALEDAGYGSSQIGKSKIGMFVGVEQGGYQQLIGEKASITANHDGILAARLAYFLGFNGPVMAINTACSSGLVAAHQACLSLQNKECDTAIAAGVNLLLIPELLEEMSRVGMLSKDGRCYAFDERANGMVAGEAVAAIVLKKLSRAKADGDLIYAVIKGSSINYDGKTNGITAPSGVAQKELLKSVYERSGVNPGDIEYIVTHGTGTKLGDPIEVNALNEVFKAYTKEQGYCALTSTKTNFGHTLAASGLVSLISLVQAHCHRIIPASLNYEQENEFINWEGSPFYVNKANKSWEDRDGKRRIGAVSAFGVSGTNAHMVVESYPGDEENGKCEEWPCFLLPLSAKNPETLREKMKDMTVLLEKKQWSKEKLTRISYTLMENRRHFNHRCAVVVKDYEDTIYILKKAEVKERLPNIFQGKVSRHFKGQKAIEQYIKELMNQARTLKDDGNRYREKLYALAELYCQGYDMPWSEMFRDKKPHRINLPTYPFLRNNYWIEGDGEKHRDDNNAVQYLHPLLQENTSDFKEQRFSSVFTGKEFFLADHIVNGQKVLPGVVYLEMGRAAVEASVADIKSGYEKIRLKNVVWLRPVVVCDRSVKVTIVPALLENGEILYEVYSGSKNKDQIVNSWGMAEIIRMKEEITLDLKALQSRKWESVLSSGDCYHMFKGMGIEYGPGHQGLKTVYSGKGDVLAKLSMPSSVIENADLYTLHPSMMDSAFQAVIGILKAAGGGKALVPFALDEAEIISRCVPSMWVYLSQSKGENGYKFDINLCDDTGKVCVRMKGLSLRVMDKDYNTSLQTQQISPGTSVELPAGKIILTPVWDTQVIKKLEPVPLSTDNIVIAGKPGDKRRAIKKYYPGAQTLEIDKGDCIDTISRKVEKCGKIDHIIYIAPQYELKDIKDEILIDDQEQGVILLYRMIKALLALGYGAKNLGWSVITVGMQSIRHDEKANPVHSSIIGLIGAAAKEYPNWKIRFVDLEKGCEWPIEEIFSLPWDSNGDQIVYREGEWYSRRLIPVNYPGKSGKLYRKGGVYVVIGGAGGIGGVWSEHMIRNYGAKIFWIGRRNKDHAIQEKLERLGKLGEAPVYIAADARNRDALERAYREIKSKYPEIHGVVHSAIVLRDKSLAKMEEERFREVLAAKVDVSVRIAQVFKEEQLDFVLFFSSMQSFVKAAGQSNYASGCTFKDAFAKRLSQEWSCAVKVINWSYWGSVGIVALKEYRDRMEKAGIGSIEPPEAIEALECLLSGPLDQIALLKTTKPLVMEQVKVDEFIDTRPENPLMDIKKILGYIPDQESELSRIREEILPEQEKMNELLIKMLWCELQSMGMVKERNIDVPGTTLRLGISDKYKRWFDESIRVLERNNYLKFEGSVYVINNNYSMDKEEVWNEWEIEKEGWVKPGLRDQVVLAELMLRNLPGILKGEKKATDIMFPNSSMKLVEGIYKKTAISEYYNDVISHALTGYMEERLKYDPSAKVRIIEIGAGTGGTTEKVLGKLKKYRAHVEEYCYTDISRAFLMHGEKEYDTGNPYLTYAIFDVGKPIAEQEIKDGSYDVVIATNVLHTTKNIRETLRNTKATLKKNGILMLNEISINSVFLHLTFGFLEGWWFYEDSIMRIPGCPGLYPGMWKQVLESEGFRNVTFPVEKAHDSGQQIIIAGSDGIVRQKRQQKAAVNLVKEKSVEKTQAGSIKLYNTQKQKGNTQLSDQMIEDHIKEMIIEKISESLKVDIDLISVDDAFSEYGVDSIIGVNLVQEINKSLDIEIETTSIFDYSTVNQLTSYILSRFKEKIGRALGRDLEIDTQLDKKKEESTGSRKEKTSSRLYSRRFLKEKALTEVDIKEKMENTDAPGRHDSIAIIGMSGRFAKSRTVKELWKNLADGINLVEEIKRWDLSKYYSKSLQGKRNYCNFGSFLDNIDKFDPLFFNISGLEATYSDPQHRIFLEESWKALEDAGYAGRSVEGRLCGVYVGCTNGDYRQLFRHDPPPQAFWGTSPAVVPARIAYFLNLQGPAIAIDTACSSSLVAIHLACQGLWNRETELALAGGVFVQNSPDFYIAAEKAEMLSPTGLCHTFDEEADGFVPGEGAGVVVLKRLKEAIADGDHIYGVIRGSGINQDGATNGITAPSVHSQERLEKYVYDSFNINPEQIQLVEAHGTGTILGDPIEFEALTRAFRHYTDKKMYCAIGSIKTNIGHTANAAGIAGVIKILLSLQYKKLLPSLHFRKGNSHINFKDSPFYVNTKLRDWDVEEHTKRCAVVSAFGFSGTNAHMVIEEAPVAERSHEVKPGYLIVLTACTKEQLRHQGMKMLEYCKEETEIDPGNLSYTLLLGRKHFHHRLACIIRNKEELVKVLKKWVDKGKALQVYVSEINKNNFREQPSIRNHGNQCIQNCKNNSNEGGYLDDLAVIADLFVQGYELEFEELFSTGGYCRISLPMYPFAEESYWIEEGMESTFISGPSTKYLHPLIHENISDFLEQRFSSVFTGHEFFLSDHIVHGQKILPGVAYLEMARAAVEASTRRVNGNMGNIMLKDVVWTRPVVVEEGPRKVNIGLAPAENGEIQYEVYCENRNEESIMYNQGTAEIGRKKNESSIDVKALRGQKWNRIITSGECYKLFRSMGLEFGPAHQGIDVLYVGEETALARLSMPSSVMKNAKEYILHPSMMDSAFQATIGLITITGGDLAVPFALDELEIMGSCVPSMWVLLRCSDKGIENKFDIDLCDETGKVCVRAKGLSFRMMDREFNTDNQEQKKYTSAPAEPVNGNVLLTPLWDPRIVRKLKRVPLPTDRIVIVGKPGNNRRFIEKYYPGAYIEKIEKGDSIDKITKRLKKNGKIDHIIWIASQNNFKDIDDETMIEEQEQGVILLYRTIKALLGLGYGTMDLSWSVITVGTLHIKQGEKANPVHAGIAGLTGSLAKEYPNWDIRIVDLENGCKWPVEEIFSLPGDSNGDQLAYRDGEWYYQRLIPVHYPGINMKLYRKGGVYVVIGGAGGIGEVWSEYMIRNYKARIIWIGRREMNRTIQEKIDRLGEIGEAPLYITADARDRNALERTYTVIKTKYPEIHGVVHSAIVLRDKSLAKMEEAQFRDGLSAKVDVSVRIAQVFKNEQLDVVLFFSSIQSFVKAAGQSNYSSGCTFKDGYANRLSQEWNCAVKIMNWGYWGSVGIVASEDYRNRMEKKGIGSIKPEEAMDALEKLVSGPIDQIVLMKTTNSFKKERGN